MHTNRARRDAQSPGLLARGGLPHIGAPQATSRLLLSPMWQQKQLGVQRRHPKVLPLSASIPVLRQKVFGKPLE